jgi:hypothetical protein
MEDPNDVTAPDNEPAWNRQKVLAIAIPCLMGWTLAYLATNIFKDYAFGLFLWLPTVMGACSTILLGYKGGVARQTLRNTSFLTLVIFCLGLLVFAWEGVICLIMVMPIGFLTTYFGYLLGFVIIERKIKDNAVPVVLLLFSTVPVLMAFEHSTEAEPEIRSVTTAVEIDADAIRVWNNVIAFPQIAAPSEWLFKAGIAYPINARIEGSGVGAIRHCNFSTGSFVEPITVWSTGKLLKFSVDSQPEPLKELSFYNIHPNHLHDYWISKGGQFRLTRLPNGHTLLEGTTWYSNKIKPGFYWTVWSDYIVHAIHRRVLEHIRQISEKAS